MTDTCSTTGKVCYTQKEADRQAGWWRTNRAARMRSFRCKSCKAWHIGNTPHPYRKRVQR